MTNIRRQGGLDNPERLGAYVNAISNHVLLESYRLQKRYQMGGEELPEQEDWRPDPESEFVTAERRKLVHSVLKDLNPRDRDLLHAAFIEERDKDQICSEMGVDGNYLRVLLHRARGRFKNTLLKRNSVAGR